MRGIASKSKVDNTVTALATKAVALIDSMIASLADDIYTFCQWLEDEGLVQASEVEGKKVYAITEDGRKFLEEHKTTVEDIFDRVAETINRFVGEPMPEVNRAVGRLVGQAYRTAWKLGDDEGKKRKIAEVLDRATAEVAGLAP